MTQSKESKRKGMCINCGVMTRHRTITAYAVVPDYPIYDAHPMNTWAYVCEACENKEYF